MTGFRRLDQKVSASPQIGEAGVAEAARQGFAMIVNNRPDGEAEDQPAGTLIEQAARSAGLDYLAIPVGHAGFSEPQIEEMRRTLARADGPVLAFCRSGTRSALLWALAEAKAGRDPDELAEAAAAAGYDVSPVRFMLDMFASQARR